MAGGGRPGPPGTLSAPRAPATTRGSVVHAFSDVAAPVTPAQIDAVLRLHDAGWPATVVLPSTDGRSRAARVCEHAGARVERFPGVGSGEAGALWYGARAAAILRDRIRQWGAVAVHAHDDAAVLVLNVDVAGVLDLTAGTVAVDASLRDSQVAGIPLSGDLAVRAEFLHDPSIDHGFRISELLEEDEGR